MPFCYMIACICRSLEVREILADQRLPECFLGVLFAAVLRFEQCSEDCELLSEVIQGILRSTQLTLELLLGTRWPIFWALDRLRRPFSVVSLGPAGSRSTPRMPS